MQATLQNVLRDLGLVFMYPIGAPWMFWAWVIVAFLIGALVVALWYRRREQAFEAWKRAEQKAVRDRQVTRRENVRLRAGIPWHG
jgi:cytochrome c-type biogenesis protein CcmH/NrfF